MPQLRVTTIVTVALALAIAAVLAIHRVVEPPVGPRILVRPVVVARRDIPRGRSLERGALILVHHPNATVPAGAFAIVDSLVGRTAARDIFKGEVIVPSRLTPIPDRRE